MDDLSKLDEMSAPQLRDVAAEIDLPGRSGIKKKSRLLEAIKTFYAENEALKDSPEVLREKKGKEGEASGFDGEIVDAEPEPEDAPAVKIPDAKAEQVFESAPEVQWYEVTKGCRFQQRGGGIADLRPGYRINRGSHDLEALRKMGAEFEPCETPSTVQDTQLRNRFAGSAVD